MKTLPARLITPTRSPAGGSHNHTAAPGGSRRIIGRPEQRFVTLHEIHDLFLIPDVIPGGEDIDVAAIQLFNDFARHAESGRGIFTIGDHEIDPSFLDDPREKLTDSPPSRLAHDVTDKEYLHGRSIAQNRRPSSPE